MTASIAIKACARDLRSYVVLQEELASLTKSPIRLCVPDEDIGAFDSIVANGVELVPTGQLLNAFGFRGCLPDNWYSQQLYKLLLLASSTTEVCWVLDANTILLKPLPDPWHKRSVALDLELQLPVDKLWFQASADFLGLPEAGAPIRAVNQPLRRSVTRKLLRWIHRVYGRPPVITLAAAMIAGVRRSQPLWTEYGLYSSFAYHFAPEAHSYGTALDRLAYYRHSIEGQRVMDWLGELRAEPPHMVKVYAWRPNYCLGDAEFTRICDQIRQCRPTSIDHQADDLNHPRRGMFDQ
jgi:hypothetical protein